jgi:hypothetical protein
MSKNIPPFSFHHEYTQEAAKSELPAEGMKLIHSGKVLKDDDIIDSCNIKPNDFLVVMIAKVRVGLYFAFQPFVINGESVVYSLCFTNA